MLQVRVTLLKSVTDDMSSLPRVNTLSLALLLRLGLNICLVLIGFIHEDV